MLALPEADPWFVTERFGERITLVTEPHVHPLLRCNVWHVRGRDRDVVVDTSLGIRPLRHLIEPELGHPLLAVATHSHSDHIGGIHEFDERAVHAAEADVMADDGRITLDATVYGEAVLGPYRDCRLRHPRPLRRRRARGRAGCGRVRSTRRAGDTAPRRW